MLEVETYYEEKRKQIPKKSFFCQSHAAMTIIIKAVCPN